MYFEVIEGGIDDVDFTVIGHLSEFDISKTLLEDWETKGDRGSGNRGPKRRSKSAEQGKQPGDRRGQSLLSL